MKSCCLLLLIIFFSACSSSTQKNLSENERNPASELSNCSSIVKELLRENSNQWPHDQHKRFISLDKNKYLTDLASHKDAWRGLLEIHFSYLDRTVLTNKKDIWNLASEISVLINEADDIRFLSLQSDAEDLVSNILEPIRLDNEKFSARGTGHPLARTMAIVAQFGPNALSGEQVSKDVFANTLIYKKHNGETYIGRMFLSKQLSEEEKHEYYTRIAKILGEINAEVLVVEAADKIHAKLYKKMGFTLREEVKGAYGEETVYVMESTLTKFKQIFLNSSQSN